MTVLATHPESRFPRPGVPVFRPDYLPALAGMGREVAKKIEALGREDAFRGPNDKTWGHGEHLGGMIDAGLAITSVPRPYRVTGTDETWLVTYAKGWVAAELHDSWESASVLYERHAHSYLTNGPGALVTERHGYWLAADWDTEGKFTWYRPNTWDPVPNARHVMADQLLEDPGIRVWAEAQPADADPTTSAICELIAPELALGVLVSYNEMADERGISLQGMRNRVTLKGIAPTLPKTGPFWSRPAARALVGPEPELTYHVTVGHALARRDHSGPLGDPGGGNRTFDDWKTVYDEIATGLTEEQAVELVAKLRGEAEGHGLELNMNGAYGWVAMGHSSIDACIDNGWVSSAFAHSNAADLEHHPPEHTWSAPRPITELAAPTKRDSSAKARNQSRRGLLPKRSA